MKAWVVVLCMLLAPLPGLAQEAPLHEVKAEIVRADGTKLPLQLEVASTPQERARGLMERTSMGKYDGMAFWFPAVKPEKFWMKDTPMPLDILFIGDDNRIVTIEHGVPQSTAHLGPDAPIATVIELAAHRAEKEGITPGDRVFYEIETPPHALAR